MACRKIQQNGVNPCRTAPKLLSLTDNMLRIILLNQYVMYLIGHPGLKLVLQSMQHRPKTSVYN